MNNLPIEILQEIFILLHQNDKLECMTVCQKWAIAIENFGLFHTVRIGDMNQMNKLIAKVQQEPSLGVKVERLVLDFDLDYDFEMDELPFYFPNVRSFFFFNMFEQNEDYGMAFTKKLSPFHPWYRHIEHLTEYSAGLHTQYILSSGICPFLKTIMIGGTDYDLDDEFIDLLSNAPALTTLSMMFFSLTVTDLELLHKVAPLLSSLTLDGGGLFRNSSNILNSLDVRPAISMKRVTFKSLTNLSIEDEIALFQYISKKYINLCDLSYDGQRKDQHETGLKKVYKEGLSPLIESLGLQLNKLSFIYKILYDYSNQNICEILDANGCQVRELELGYMVGLPMIKGLARSNQVRFIQSLTVKHISDTSNLEWLKGFTSLKNLCLYHPYQKQSYKSNIIKLDDLLKFGGYSLESLQIRAHNLTVDSNNSVRSYPLLKYLIFDKALVPAWIDKFISQSFPQLKKLTFKLCDFSKKNIFIIPNIDLSHFEMIHNFPRKIDVQLGITTLINNGEERCYTVKPTYSWNRLGLNDANIYPAITSQLFDRMIMGSPYFKLVCNSVHHVFIVNVM